MVNDLVLESFFFEPLIGHERIGINRATCFDMSADVSLQRVLFTIADHSGANLTTTLQNSHDGGLVFGASLSNPATMFVSVHESRSATNKSFVYFHFAPRPTNFQERAVLHRKTDSVKHEPCGLLSDAKSAAHFIRTDTVLAIGNHPDSDKPFVQTNRRILKDGSNLDGKLPMMMNSLALPFALVFEEHNIIPFASGAGNNAIRPAQLDHEFQAVVRVGEVNDGLLESLWLGAHVVPHKPNVPKAV